MPDFEASCMGGVVCRGPTCYPSLMTCLGTAGGDKPNLADLAVFGVLRPIRNMQTGRDMMEHTDVGQWYARMEAEVGVTARLPDQ